MRFTAPAIALALGLATVSSVSIGRAPDYQINPKSVELVTTAKREAASGRFDAAVDSLETALAVDPRNRLAYLTLADVALKQQLPGKAIRYYREALLIDPNDVAALAGQGNVLVQKGAVAKAKENLARIEKLCLARCPEQATLAAAIARGPATPVVSMQAIKPNPTITPAVPQSQ